VQILFKIILALHITGGSIGLIAGTINMVRKKGDKTHKAVGKFFLYGMLAAGTAALALSVMHPNYFLFIVGVFTIYMASTGKRYLSLRESADGPTPKMIDWALSIFMLLFGIAFIGFGIYKFIKGNTFGIVFLVFGYISVSMVRQDIKNYNGKSPFKNTWMLLHLQRMIGAYIAALTAFLVVNMPQTILPGYLNFIPWLTPTIALVPLIFKWTAQRKIMKPVPA
jgi:uncharacterized membrane protein